MSVQFQKKVGTPGVAHSHVCSLWFPYPFLSFSDGITRSSFFFLNFWKLPWEEAFLGGPDGYQWARTSRL